MPTVTVTPFVMRNAILELGTDDYAKAVSSATLTPSGGITTFKGLKPDAVFTYPQSTTWTLDLEYAQDWGIAGSLSVWLFNNQGTNQPFELTADDVAGSTVWNGTVVITAGAVGGAVDSVATATVSLGVVGQPVPTFPVVIP